MTGREVLQRIRRAAKTAGVECDVVSGKGSHRKATCGVCEATVPMHGKEDIPPGTLRAIERQLEPCLGKRWLR